jgi:hypothetical protein
VAAGTTDAEVDDLRRRYSVRGAAKVRRSAATGLKRWRSWLEPAVACVLAAGA